GVTAATDGATRTLGFSEPMTLKGFTYAPPADGAAVFRYTAEVSTDNGRTWSAVEGLTGEFSNIQNNPIPQTVTFAAPFPAATNLRLRATELTTGSANTFPGTLIPLR
ncbi:MAG: hypothetical protein NC210_10035, partial [[Clostridium] fimetarium]|nr:hypothetical protein [[Clostridium] fimetarium]